jgi:hypothetical protein
MFNLHDFVMDTLMGMVGREPDYKVRQYALGWYDKAQLTGEDMDALETAIQTAAEEMQRAAEDAAGVGALEGAGM